MPQVETLVSSCTGDRKIACETLADGDQADQPKTNPDSPPESFWLSKDQEFDWWDRNAVYERKDSGKGGAAAATTTSNSNSTNLNPNFRSKSQRVSLKSKASIFGLPKPQKPSFADAKSRRKNTRLFPKRSTSTGKSESSLHEPSSPKVSCMGRVRSRRDRNRRMRSRQRSSESGPVKEKLIRSKSRSNNRKQGFFESFRAIFRSRQRENKEEKSELPLQSGPTRARNSAASDFGDSFAESTPRNSVSGGEPPGLGGMKRFASGRRSGAWDVGEAEIHAPV